MMRMEREGCSRSRRDAMMPKFILATAALLLRQPFPPAADVYDMHDTMHATTRSRESTRRLRASKVQEPYVDLSPLDLSRRH